MTTITLVPTFYHYKSQVVGRNEWTILWRGRENGYRDVINQQTSNDRPSREFFPCIPIIKDSRTYKYCHTSRVRTEPTHIQENQCVWVFKVSKSTSNHGWKSQTLTWRKWITFLRVYGSRFLSSLCRSFTSTSFRSVRKVAFESNLPIS